MLMGETACTAGKSTQVSVSEHMGKLAHLSKCVFVCACVLCCFCVMSECSLSCAFLKSQTWKIIVLFRFSFLLFFFCPVCVFIECAHIKLSMSDWRQGPGWAVKQRGAPTSCAVIIKSTSVFAKAVSGNDAVIEMHDLLWLQQMDTWMRERQTIHTPLLVWANSLNYAGLRGIKLRAPILPKLLRVWIIYG